MWMYSYIHGLKRYTLRGEKDDYVQSPSMYNHLLLPREITELPDIDVTANAMYTRMNEEEQVEYIPSTLFEN